MHPAVDADRELLLATARRHEAELSTEALFAMLAAADELIEPGRLPVLVDVDETMTAHLLGVVRAVRRRLSSAAVAATAPDGRFPLRAGGPPARRRRARNRPHPGPVSYSSALASLSGAIAGLLTADQPRPDQATMTPTEAVRALSSRDVLVGEVRALTVELTGPFAGGGADLRPQHLVSDPLHVLREALRQLPRAVVDPGRPTDVLAPGGGLWGDVALGAVQLEASHDRIAGLPGPAAWEVAGEVGEVAGAIGHLDADLAARLPGDLPGGLPVDLAQARAALTGPVAHGLLRLAAGQLQTQLLGRPAVGEHRDLLDAEPAQAVAQLLAVGLQTAHRHGVLGQEATGAAAEAVQALRHAASTALATPAAPDPRLRVLTGEVYRQIRRSSEPGRTVAALTGWAGEASATADALSTAVEAAGSAGRLFGRPGETSRERPRDAHRLWVKVPPAEAELHPVVVHLHTAADALERLEPAPPNEPARSQVDVRRQAVLSASGASAELRSAIGRRRKGPSVNEALPPNPAQRRIPGSHIRPQGA